MKPFHEHLRYVYPLTSESVVVDCGAYHGQWSKAMAEKYCCRVFAFEPVKAFYDQTCLATAHLPNVTVRHLALGAKNERRIISVRNDSTGFFAESQEQEEVDCRRIDEALDAEGLKHVDVLKLNCEGSEFEILELLIAKHDAGRFGNIQVQFHDVVQEARDRHQTIRESLLKTHDLTWGEPFLWENYRLKP